MGAKRKYIAWMLATSLISGIGSASYSATVSPPEYITDEKLDIISMHSTGQTMSRGDFVKMLVESAGISIEDMSRFNNDGALDENCSVSKMDVDDAYYPYMKYAYLKGWLVDDEFDSTMNSPDSDLQYIDALKASIRALNTPMPKGDYDKLLYQVSYNTEVANEFSLTDDDVFYIMKETMRISSILQSSRIKLDETLTKAHLMQVVSEMTNHGIDALGYKLMSNFADVSEDDWFAPYVAFTHYVNWFDPDNENKFNPYSAVALNDLCEHILRYLEIELNPELSASKQLEDIGIWFAVEDENAIKYGEALRYAHAATRAYEGDNHFNRIDLLETLANDLGVLDEANNFSGASYYTDVQSSFWYAPLVWYAASEGWLDKGEVVFNARETVSFEYASRVIAGALGYNIDEAHVAGFMKMNEVRTFIPDNDALDIDEVLFLIDDTKREVMPNDETELTRGNFGKYLSMCYGAQKEASEFSLSTVYKDVSKNHKNYNYVSYVYHLGWADVEKGYFRPDAPLTLESASEMILKACEYKTQPRKPIEELESLGVNVDVVLKDSLTVEEVLRIMIETYEAVNRDKDEDKDEV